MSRSKMGEAFKAQALGIPLRESKRVAIEKKLRALEYECRTLSAELESDEVLNDRMTWFYCGWQARESQRSKKP